MFEMCRLQIRNWSPHRSDVAKVRRHRGVERWLNVSGDVVLLTDFADDRRDQRVGSVRHPRKQMMLGLVIEATGVPTKKSTQGTRSV